MLCGKIFRIKGFVKDAYGQCYEVNCTGQICSVRKTDNKKNSLVLIGQKVRLKGLKNLGFDYIL